MYIFDHKKANNCINLTILYAVSFCNTAYKMAGYTVHWTKPLCGGVACYGTTDYSAPSPPPNAGELVLQYFVMTNQH